MATATTGAVAESIRTLRTRILYPVIGNTPRTLLITSASPGEGKSFICANLGISLAQGVDDYCILVDCDLRRPSQHQMFGVSNERGLVNHLQQNIAAEELIIKSGVDKLSILPAGPPPVNPAELSGSDSMIKLVNEMKERYDDRFVLLDSPPLHAAAETAVLAQHVDGVILVIRQGKSRREHVKALADTIGRDKIISVVFNAHQTNVLDTKIFGYQDYKAGYYYQEK
nr:CpsD/CapB family tyrosine-protein kinase [Desulfogranum marinum]